MTDTGIMLTVEGREIPLSRVSIIKESEARRDEK